MIHDLKVHPIHFVLHTQGIKNDELRMDDREDKFKVGDYLLLREWCGEYTGNTHMVEVLGMLKEHELLMKGVVLMYTRKVEK